jgi:hypothetical protein
MPTLFSCTDTEVENVVQVWGRATPDGRPVRKREARSRFM